MAKRMVVVLAVVLAIGMASGVYGATSVNWAFSLESNGSDVSWTSTSRLSPGFDSYDYSFNLSQFELNAEGIGWQDYSGDVEPVGEGAGYNGLPLGLLNLAHNAEAIDFNLHLWVDDQGYAHAELSDIAFGLWGGLNVDRIRISGTIDVAAMSVLWEDNFDGYGTDMFLNDSPNWTEASEKFKVGPTRGSRALYDNGYWMDSPRIASAQFDAPAYDPNHCRIRVDAWEWPSIDSNVACQWYVLARVSSSGHVRVGAVLGEHEGNRAVYMRMADTQGYTDGDYYVADFNPANPMIIELDVNNNDIKGRVIHSGASYSRSYTTQMTSKGDPGMAGWNPWGYAKGYFEDFTVYTTSASDPTSCGEEGTLYLTGDLNLDCRVDLKDISVLAAGWLDCNDPENDLCN